MKQIINQSTAARIKSFFQAGIRDVNFDEIIKLGLEPGDDIQVEPNLILERQYMFKQYKLRLKDQEKDIEGRWLDDCIKLKNIISALNDYKISSEELIKSNELAVNKSLETHLRKYFASVHMSSGNQRSYFDLVIGNMDFVIEIKLSRALKKTAQMQKAIGQIDGYIRELNNNNLILLVIGNQEDRFSRNISYIRDNIENQKNSIFFYLDTD